MPEVSFSIFHPAFSEKKFLYHRSILLFFKKLCNEIAINSISVTVHSYFFVSRFQACMKICLQKSTEGAPLYEQKGDAKQRRASKRGS